MEFLPSVEAQGGVALLQLSVAKQIAEIGSRIKLLQVLGYDYRFASH